MMTTLQSRVQEEIANNRIWRAKELLQSYIGSSAYDETLYLEYAKLLYALGDHLESGKYFLLTSTQEPAHQEAIKLFLSRHHNETFFFQFPRQFKKVHPKNYPQNLKNVMGEDSFLKKQILLSQKSYKSDRPYLYQESKTEKIVIAAIALFFGLMLLVGIITSAKFLWHLL